MPDFDKPSFVTAAGTRALVAASPDGLLVRTRAANGSESSAAIPADVALELLKGDNVDQLRAALAPPAAESATE